MQINTPRDRAGTFEPQIVASVSGALRGSTTRSSRSTRAGLSTRDIEAHLEEIYGVKVGRDLISKVTDAVMEDARAWQTRPLDDVYPVVFLDALVLKIRDGGSVSAQGVLPGAGDRRWTVTATCSACGFRPTRARSSGCRSSPSSNSAASKTS